jgi:hypothetical protein
MILYYQDFLDYQGATKLVFYDIYITGQLLPQSYCCLGRMNKED